MSNNLFVISAFIPNSLIIPLIIACLLTLLINLPFGYYRGRTKKFSVKWFLAIHLPVPFIILFRKINGIDLAWNTEIFILVAYLIGQFIGKKIYTRVQSKKR